MEKFESVFDILDFAINRENLSIEFYENIAQQMSDPTESRIFQQLAAEEAKHKAMLELEVLKRGKVIHSNDEFPELDDTLVLPAVEPESEGLYQEALLMAVKKEKASFHRYFDLALKIDDEEMRQVLTELAEEEAGHKVLFELEYDKSLKHKS